MKILHTIGIGGMGCGGWGMKFCGTGGPGGIIGNCRWGTARKSETNALVI